MEKREIVLYTITIISLLAFIYIVIGTFSRIPKTSNNELTSLTGNVIISLETNFKIGDNINGNIIINQKEANAYGVLLLTKDNKPLISKTFNLKDIPKNIINSGYSIKIEDLINYKFEEKGNYELFLSVLDLDINIKGKFVIE